ncbi:MAG: hypothetical protein KBT05_06295 [Bacteroidales bacterium]|nr:hypothetical protein [Candidatus Cryptobacteroides caccocaballi]
MANPNKRTYAKVVKIVEWLLLAVSVAIILFGVFAGFESNGAKAIDLMLYWAYALVVIALVAIIILGVGANAARSKKSAISIVGVLVGVCALVAIAYVLAPGSEAIGLVGEQPSATTLKLTDTVMNLTYIAAAAAVVSIVASAIINAIRK